MYGMMITSRSSWSFQWEIIIPEQNPKVDEKQPMELFLQNGTNHEVSRVK